MVLKKEMDENGAICKQCIGQWHSLRYENAKILVRGTWPLCLAILFFFYNLKELYLVRERFIQ